MFVDDEFGGYAAKFVINSPLYAIALRSQPVCIRRGIFTQGAATCLRIQQSIQPLDRMRVIFPAPADITHKRREIGHGDQLVIQPGEVSQVLQA